MNFFTINNRCSRKGHVVMITLTVLVVYFSSCRIVKAEPCFVKAIQFFCRQRMPELASSSVQYGEFGAQECINIIWPIDWIRINIRKRLIEDRYNFSGRFFSGINFCQLESKLITYPGTKERTNESSANTDQCYFIGTKIQFYISAIDGILIG